MNDKYELKTVARIRSDFPTKFGIPRQAGIVEELEAEIVFEPEYRNPDALRGLEGFSHIWLIWQFSRAVREDWSPTVRPPRLGGNERMGVFATRSPFRPNALGLSCVRISGIRTDAVLGPVISVRGADLMDGTPIYDIKPYIPYSDIRPDALSGFAPDSGSTLRVEFCEGVKEKIPENKLAALIGVLENDPRPRYKTDSDRVYAMEFAGYEVKFMVENGTLTVTDIDSIPHFQRTFP